MEDIIDIIVTETTNTIEITAQPNDEIIDVNIIDNREDITLNVTPTLVEVNINSLVGNFGINWGEITGTLSNQTDLNTALGLKADLVGGKVPSSQLPSYVDDVVEVANYASLPATGETGKIYITIDTNYIYRWTGSVYVEIKDSSAVWGAITGTLSNQTDLQNALNAKDAVLTFSSPLSRSTNTVSIPAATTSVNGYLTSTDWTTFNAKQAQLNGTGFIKASGTTISYDNTSYLPLTGGTLTGNLLGTNITISNSLIAKGGTFNGGASYGGIVTIDGLGSDLLMNRADTSNGTLITMLTNAGEMWSLGMRSVGNDNFYLYNIGLTANALTIAKSNSAATFASSVTATSLIKSGGTSSQFLKADGSVDSSTYLTTGTAASTYLPLSGGTLTGALSGTSVSLSSSVTASALYVTGMTAGSGAIYHTGSRLTFANYNASGTLHFEVNGGTGALTLNSNLSATFASTLSATGATLTGALSGTGASFSDTITSTLAGHSARGLYFTANQPSGINWYDTDDVEQYSMGIIANSGAGYWGLWSSTSSTAIDRSVTTPIFKIARAGAATFSSSVTATTGTFDYTAVNGGASVIARNSATSGQYTNAGYQIWAYNGTSVTLGASFGLTSSTFSYQQVIGNQTNLYGYQSGGLRLATVNAPIIFALGASDPDFSTEKMRITSGGNVGIGTNSPSFKLSVVGTTDSVIYAVGANNTYKAEMQVEGAGQFTGSFVAIPSGGSTYGGITSSNVGITTSSTALVFATTNTERMRITSGGDVFIGSTSTINSERLFVRQSSSANLTGIAVGYGTSANQFRSMSINSSNVMTFNNGTNEATLTSAGAWSNASDARLKKNIVDIKYGLNTILESQPRSFNRVDVDGDYIGFIAQELLDLIPEVVSGDLNSQYCVDYGSLVAISFKAIQELKAELDTLKNK